MWWSVGRVRVNKIAFLIAAFMLLMFLFGGWRLIFTSGTVWLVVFVLPFFYVLSRQRNREKRKHEQHTGMIFLDPNAKPKREHGSRNGRYAVGDDGELIEVEPPRQASGRDDVV
jgi:fatty acid desaturase